MLSCILIPLQMVLLLSFSTMKTIYVIIHHYFDEDEQKEVNMLYSEWDYYSEALCQIEAIKKLSKYEGWFEIKQVTTYSDRIYGM